MADVPLQVIRPWHAHGNAPPSMASEDRTNSAPPPNSTSAPSYTLAHPASLSVDITNPSIPAHSITPSFKSNRPPWYRRRLCFVPIWAFLPITIILIIFIILALALCIPAVNKFRSKQINTNGIRSDYWYTICESSNAVSRGYLNDFARPENGKNVMDYPMDIWTANYTHSQFLRVLKMQLSGEPLPRICQTAVHARTSLYELLNKVQGPLIRLGINTTGFGTLGGPGLEERYAEDGIELVLQEDKKMETLSKLWYVEKRTGDEQSFGRRWDGSTNGAEVTLLKNNGADSEKTTTWTISTNMGGKTIKITDPRWQSFE